MFLNECSPSRNINNALHLPNILASLSFYVHIRGTYSLTINVDDVTYNRLLLYGIIHRDELERGNKCAHAKSVVLTEDNQALNGRFQVTRTGKLGRVSRRRAGNKPFQASRIYICFNACLSFSDPPRQLIHRKEIFRVITMSLKSTVNTTTFTKS